MKQSSVAQSLDLGEREVITIIVFCDVISYKL